MRTFAEKLGNLRKESLNFATDKDFYEALKLAEELHAKCPATDEDEHIAALAEPFVRKGIPGLVALQAARELVLNLPSSQS